MKRILWLGLTAFLLSLRIAYSQADTAFYDHKISKFNHVRSGGFVMAGVGTGVAFIGTALLLDLPTGYWSDDYNSSYITTEDDIGYAFQAIGGIICTAVGVGLLAGGITMAAIGSRKSRIYQEKRNNLRVGFMLTPNRQGITLSYRF